MAPKRVQNTGRDNDNKKQRKSLSLEVKLEVLKRLESGERQHEVATALGLAGSTVRTIIKNTEKIMQFSKIATPLSATQITRTRSTIMVDMERLLSVWIEEQTQRKIPLSWLVIQSKALSLHKHLQKDLPPDTNVDAFVASHGWFERFKRRAKLHNVAVSGEAASANIEGAEIFKETMAKLIEENGYTPQQVFNVDETGLFWKRMPKRTYISIEENTMPGFKVSKDRLTLLLGGNASGDYKLKPMLIYHSKNPRAFKNCSKAFLPVIWKSNKKAWVTRDIFEDWFSHHFCPSVKDYCEKNKLTHKALLLLDNAPGHPTTLNELDEHVKVIFLPPNTTSILQPMDQGVIANFKAYYLRTTFDQAIKKTDGKDSPSLTQFWKDFNIKNAVNNIGKSWDEVTIKTMNGAWRKLWPDCVSGNSDCEGVDNVVQGVVETIVQLGRELGFNELEASDITDLLESHHEPLSDEDLVDLEQQRALDYQDEKNEAVQTKIITTANLNEIFKLQDTLIAGIMKNDPQMERSSMVIRNVEQSLHCYKVLLEEKKKAAKQSKLDSFCFTSPRISPSPVDQTAMPSTSGFRKTFFKPTKKTANQSSDDGDCFTVTIVSTSDESSNDDVV